MITRRGFGAGIGRAALGAAALPLLAPAGWGALAFDGAGLPTQPWFVETFLHLAEDAAEAQAAGRMLAVLWEQKGCPGCIKLHEVNFKDPTIAAYARERFTWVQMNIHGDRAVTGLDGRSGSEKEVARTSRATFTPTIQFITPDPHPREVARMPGYLEPAPFLLMLRYAAEGHWRQGDFPSFARAQGT